MSEKYLIVLEKSNTGYSAYSPDVLGCIATGKTIDLTIAKMRSALSQHLLGIIEDGDSLPQPGGIASYLDVVDSSEGEEYLLTHISLEQVLPERILA